MQNPSIYSGGNSPVCQLMWDIKDSCENKCHQQLIATRSEGFKEELMSSIPHKFYKNIDKNIIIDKCRAWTLKNNYEMIVNHIDRNPKIIIFIRDIEEILKSFIRIGFIPKVIREDDIFNYNSEPLMKYFYGVIYAKQNYQENIHIVDYNEFIKNIDKEMLKIYNFLEIEYFKHQYVNIIDNTLENDEAYGILGMHSIKSNIKKEDYRINISNMSIEKCNYLNSILFN